jgi:hypothetical protein
MKDRLQAVRTQTGEGSGSCDVGNDDIVKLVLRGFRVVGEKLLALVVRPHGGENRVAPAEQCVHHMAAKESSTALSNATMLVQDQPPSQLTSNLPVRRVFMIGKFDEK